jgi:hypothetical protein
VIPVTAARVARRVTCGISGTRRNLAQTPGSARYFPDVNQF